MSSMVPPAKNEAFTFYISLEDQANPGLFKANPTIASGDVLVATDDAAPANISSLPSVDADFTRRVKVSLSADEMNGDNVTVIFSDAAGAEWYDLTVNIQTATVQMDDVATAASVAALNNLSAAQVNAEVDTALADIHLDHLLAVAESDTPADNSIIAKIAAGGDWSSFDAGDNSLVSISNEIENNVNAVAVLGDLTTTIGTPSNLGSGATVAANLVDIEGQTDDIGAAGAGLTALGDTRIANLDATISSRAAAATLTTIGARIGTFTGSGVNNILGFLQAIMRKDVSTPSDVGGTYDDATDSLEAIRDRGDAAWTGSTAADVAAAVWDEAIAGHLSAGSTGAALNSSGSGADPWDDSLPGAYSAGTAGYIIGNIEDLINDAVAGLSSTPSVTVISTVAGATATVYQYATWEAAFTLSGSPGLTGYENLIFAVKRYASDTDAQSVLYVNSATGLIYIGQAAATGASYGSLTADSATQFTVYVDVAEVASKIAANFGGSHTWTLKGIETGTTPDEAIVIATGTWRIEPGYVRSLT